MDSAPHDGSHVKVGAYISFKPDKFVTGKAYFDGARWRWAYNYQKCYPTHWIPNE
jgi:hypothetical protein